MKNSAKRILRLLSAWRRLRSLLIPYLLPKILSVLAVKMAPKSPNKGDTASEMELIEHCRAIERI